MDQTKGPKMLSCSLTFAAMVALNRPLVKAQDLTSIEACALGTSKPKLCKYQLISKTNF
jgi:hypothetical protein